MFKLREILQDGTRLLRGPGDRLKLLSKLRIWGPIKTLVKFHMIKNQNSEVWVEFYSDNLQLSEIIVIWFLAHLCELLPSLGVRPSSVCKLFQKSPLKSLGQFKPNLAWIILRGSPLEYIAIKFDTYVIFFQNYGWGPHPPSNMATIVTINRKLVKKFIKKWF
jgi:hypothetical protein